MNKAVVVSALQVVKTACESENNAFGQRLYNDHILEVVKHAATLSRALNADEEIVILAALLHDYAGIACYSDYKIHHIKSADFAFAFLCAQGYPKERAKHVADCIYEHRGSVVMEKRSLESICVASADAMAHISNWPSLLNYANQIKALPADEAKAWVCAKLKRSWHKMIAVAKDQVSREYCEALSKLQYAAVS